MKAKKLVLISVFALLACTMLAVCASAAEVDTYYFAGDYIRYTVKSNSTSNGVAEDAGSLRVTPRTDGGAVGTATARFAPFPTAEGEKIATAAYPYISVNFKTNHNGDVQFWPFTPATTAGYGANLADGAKLANGSYQNDAWQNDGITDNGIPWTAKLSFHSNDFVNNATLGTTTFTPDALENSTKNWAAKTDKTLPTYYEDLVINLRDGSTSQSNYADFKYIALHNDSTDMYSAEDDDSTDDMDKIIEAAAILDNNFKLVFLTKDVEDEDSYKDELKAYAKAEIEAAFAEADLDDVTVSVGELTSPYFNYYTVNLTAGNVYAYDIVSVKVEAAPEFTFNNLGAQIRADGDASALRFGFEIAQADWADYDNVTVGATVVPVDYSGVAEVVIAKNFTFVDGVYSFNVVVTNIPDGSEKYNNVNKYGADIIAVPFVICDGGEPIYGTPITRSVDGVTASLEDIYKDWDKD